MKKLLFIPLTVMVNFIFGSNVQETPLQPSKIQSEQTHNHPEQKLIDEVIQDYREGRYSSFLKKIDISYEKDTKKWQYNDVLAHRKKLSSLVKDYGKKNESKKQSYEAQKHTLLEEQYRELTDVCINYPNEKLSREVRDMVFFSPSKHQKECLEFFHNLSYKFTGDGKTPLENKLINIDTEFWLKELSLGVAKSQNKVDMDDYTKKRFILQMEKLKKMQESCEADEFGDIESQEKIKVACELAPKVFASSLTRKYLNDLDQGNIHPETEAEKKLKEVMIKYKEKENLLNKEFFPESQIGSTE